MFKKLFKSKEDFYTSFQTELSNASPNFLSIEFGDRLIKSTLEVSGSKKLGLEITNKNLTLTNLSNVTKKVPEKLENKEEIQTQIKRVILEKFEQAKKEIHLFPNISPPTDGETKGEEWLKVTNLVLKESLKKAASDDTLLIDAKIFLGSREKEGELNFRLQCYNLDYSLTFLTNGKLYVSVFDDKNFKRGHSEKPSYNGEFFNNRPVILDEFIKLIIDICTHGKLF